MQILDNKRVTGTIFLILKPPWVRNAFFFRKRASRGPKFSQCGILWNRSRWIVRQRCEIACKRRVRKTRDFEGYDGFLPSRDRDTEVWWSLIRRRVEMREGIRISATRWAEDNSTVCLGAACGLPVTQAQWDRKTNRGG